MSLAELSTVDAHPKHSRWAFFLGRRSFAVRFGLAFLLLVLATVLALGLIFRIYGQMHLEDALTQVAVSQIRMAQAWTQNVPVELWYRPRGTQAFEPSAQGRARLAPSRPHHPEHVLNLDADEAPPFMPSGLQAGGLLLLPQSALPARVLQRQQRPVPPPLQRVEARVAAEVGFPVRVLARLRPPHHTWLLFELQGRPVALFLPVPHLERTWPTPMLIWMLVVFTGAVFLVLLVVFWLQRPLWRFTQALNQQRLAPTQVPLPPGASAEVQALVAAYNARVAEGQARDQARDIMLAGISHDLKTPLTRLRMRAEMLDDSQMQAAIVRDVQSMDKILSQFMDFMRSGSGPVAASCDLVAVVQHWWARVAPLHPEVQGPLPAPALPPCHVALDAAGVERLLDNLLDNALSYGAPPWRLTLTLEPNPHLDQNASATAQPSWLSLAMIDHGPGIPEADLARVQQAFVRLDHARTGRGHSGLGLTIVSQLAQRAGGRWQARSLPEGAFCSAVLLPYTSAPPLSAP